MWDSDIKITSLCSNPPRLENSSVAMNVNSLIQSVSTTVPLVITLQLPNFRLLKLAKYNGKRKKKPPW